MILLALPIGILALKLFFSSKVEKNKDKIFMFLSCIFIILFIGLRSRYTGSPDTRTYATMFEQAQGQNLFNFLNNKEITLRNFIFNEGLFYFLLWALAQIFNNAQVLIFISSLFITLGVASFIWKNSKSDTLSLLLYICLGLLTFSMNGMRQAIAMTICLLSFEFVKKKNLFKFLLTIFIAFTFHRTAIVFLLVYLLFNYKSSLFTNILVGVLSVVFLLNTNRIAETYDYFTGKDYSLSPEFESGGFVTVLIYVIIIILSLIYLIVSKKQNKQIVTKLTLLSFVGLILYISRYISTQIYERVSYYFFYFPILLLPELESLFDKKNGVIFKYVVAILAIMLFTYRLSVGTFSDFNFFW